MRSKIPGFPDYFISDSGKVFNSQGKSLKLREFKNTLYVRLSKDGTRSTLSVNKLLFQKFDLVDKHLPLDQDEIGIRYEQTHYFFTNKLRCYNLKTRRFLKPVYRNNYPSFTLCYSGRKEVVFPLSFIKSYFKRVV